MRLAVARVDRENGGEGGLRLGEPAQPPQSLALAVVRLGRVGRERQRRVRVRQRLGVPPVALRARRRVEPERHLERVVVYIRALTRSNLTDKFACSMCESDSIKISITNIKMYRYFNFSRVLVAFAATKGTKSLHIVVDRLGQRCDTILHFKKAKIRRGFHCTFYKSGAYPEVSTRGQGCEITP